MKEDILRLRKEGKTYNQIVKELKCSKGTVAYHCGCGQKEKTKQRTRKFRKGESKSQTINDRKCQNCDQPTKNKKYCSIQCQKDFQYDNYIERWKDGEEDGNISNRCAISGHIRKYLWIKYNNQCSRCGWNTPNPVTGKPILEIEHLDGNSENNKPENLDLICPNCHSLTTTYKALNSGNGNQKRLKYNKLK